MEGFLAALAPAVRADWAAVADLDARLDALVDAAHAAHPALAGPPADLLAYLAERIPADVAAAEVLDSLRAGDLALARACAVGAAGAIERFEAELFDEVDLAWGRFRHPPLDRGELRQALREHLFVGPGRPPRVAGYQGRGSLRAWLRMTATRFMLDQVRAHAARPEHPATGELAELPTTDDDPELAFLKRTYRADFRVAFAAALAALEPRARNILRHRYLDGLEVDALAAIYGLHRVSMSRTLTRIRDDLHASVRRTLMTRLGLDRSELDSLLAMISSHLEVSLGGLLRSTER